MLRLLRRWAWSVAQVSASHGLRAPASSSPRLALYSTLIRHPAAIWHRHLCSLPTPVCPPCNMGRSKRAAAVGGAPATPPPPAPAAAPLCRSPAAAAAAPRLAKRRRSSHSKNSDAAAAAASAAAAEMAVEPAIPLSAPLPDDAPAALEDVLPASAEGDVGEGRRVTRRRGRRGQAAAGSSAAADGETVQQQGVDQGKEEEEEADEGTVPAQAKVKRKGGGRRREPDPPPLKDLPSEELLARLRAEGFSPPSLPVPNLGYACLNMELRELKPPVFTSRDCVQRTKQQKGLPHLGELFLANCRDLALLIQWNHEHNIRLFRMSSVLCPWMGTFDMADLPQYAEISTALRLAGDLARLYDQRVTFHPSHFVKLAAPDEQLAAKSIRELEAHSQVAFRFLKVMDLMGFEPSLYNKINIHVGGVYASQGFSKEDTMRRWAANFAKLSPRCRTRMTVENDDIANSFSLQDLLFLHSLCGIALVFDFHHHKFCPGGLSEREALMAAVATWPQGVRPVVHWSESQAGRKPHAHSDYVRGPIMLHGLEGEVDVMIEAKCKERALLAYRGDIPLPDDAAEAAAAAGEQELAAEEAEEAVAA